MPKYRYIALDNGSRVEGEIDAPDAESARAKLEWLHLTVESVVEVGNFQGTDPADPIPLNRGRAREVSQHIADLTEAGLPLADGLRAVAAEIPRNRTQTALLQIAARMDAGDDLSTILKTHRAPRDLRAIVEAGLEIGNPGEAIAEYLAHARTMTMLRRRASLALIYPCLMFAATLMLITFVMGYTVPEFKKIFEDFGTELPGITELMIWISDLFVAVGLTQSLILETVAIGITIWVVWVFGGVLLDRWLVRIPVVGSVLRWASLARFAHLFAVLIDHQMPLNRALSTAGEGASDRFIESACNDIAARLEAGEPLETTELSYRGFPASLVRMLTWQRDREGFSEAIHALADMYEGRVRANSTAVVALLEPFLIAGIALLVGFIVIAMFLPMFKLLGALS